MSELLSTAASLSVWGKPSDVLAVQRTEFNKWAAPFRWDYLWEGSGPDYLVCDLSTYERLFVEVKGYWGQIITKPPKFVKHKTQSLNAEIKLFSSIMPVDAHILSYGTISADKPLEVWQFNNRPREFLSGRDDAFILVTALTQFLSDLSAAGHSELISAVRSEPRAPDLQQMLRRRLTLDGNIWIAQQPGLRMGIENDAVEIFVAIAKWQKLWRNWNSRTRAIPEELVDRLLALSRAESVHLFEDDRLFRTSTGISFWQTTDIDAHDPF